MKRILLFLLAMLFYSNLIFSQGLGIGAGLSFWTGNDVSINTLKVITQDKNPGFNLNIRVKLGNGDYLRYLINVGWSKFTIEDIRIVDPRTSEPYELRLSQNVFPVSAGLQLGLPLSALKLYVSGEISYNIIKNSIDYRINSAIPALGVPVMFGDKTAYRIGAAPGIGAELKLGIITLDLNLKMHFMNLINKEDNETSTTFLMTNLSVFFQ